MPFLNYHTVWIKRVLVKKGFRIVKKYGCSFFRIQVLKRMLSSKVLLFFENISQNIFSFLDLSPSIFIKSIKDMDSKKNIGEDMKDILVCPKCKGDLNITDKKAVCKECKKEYYKKENIWDFRI